MAESLLLPLVSKVAGTAGDALVQRVTRMWGVDNDREKLERRLLAVQSLLADAEVKSETNPAVKRWTKDLKAVAYKADDVLDDFQYEALRREALNRGSMARKVLSYFTSQNRLIFRHKASKELKTVLGRIDELVSEMNTFGLVERAEVPQVLYRQTHSALDECTEIFGRGDEKEVVVKLLLDQQDQKSVQVLPIIGMGGLGKTTLAKMVYNDHRVQNHFELKMWHCVSENFEATAVLRSIMIVVTSRSPKVAAIMGTLRSQELVCLTEDDSWGLFSKKAFSKGVQEETGLVAIGKRIIKKCKGLPLALKTMGGLMSSKQQVQEWEAIAESDTIDQEEVLSVLKLSYRHLSAEMKQCFVFCAVFPKDYEMEKDRLIELWVANGFIHQDRTMGLEQKGELVFNELAWRSFLQDVNVKRNNGRIVCKMHDLMHDLAKDVTDESVFAEELIQKKVSIKDVRHMHMSEGELQKISELKELKLISSLRTLLTDESQVSEHMGLKELKLTSLRALRCRDTIMCSQLINTAHIRYLDLFESSTMVRLPNSVCMLYNLQTLRLNNCSRLQYLPEGMAAMRKLRHLYLFGCASLERMPPNLGLLQNLRTLTTFVVHTRAGCGINELKDLSQLSNNRLVLFNLRKDMCWGGNNLSYTEGHDANKSKEVLESLEPHDKLKTLEVHGYGGLAISQWMGNPQMLQYLTELRISYCPRCKDLPIVWLSPTLEYLSLSYMDNLTTLCKNIDVESDGSNTSLQILPKLKTIMLHNLPEFERWAENSAGQPISTVMIPLLENLDIEGCCKLSTLPESPALTSLSLHRGREEPVSVSMPLASWPSLVRLQIGLQVEAVMPLKGQQCQRPLNSLRNLIVGSNHAFTSIFNLSTVRLGLFDYLAFVELLTITYCTNIKRFPVEKLDGNGSSSKGILPMPLLKKLTILSCNSLLEIPELPASLATLIIQNCRSLVALPSNLGSLGMLRDISVGFCPGLNALPDGMEGLTSLEYLDIVGCPGIEEFPQGLLQRLPSLKHLDIRGSPHLQRGCGQDSPQFQKSTF
ncbi:hypothetical protein ACP4OV_005350 [Aristida adscensionis]